MIEEIKQKAGVKILLAAPKVSVGTEGPSKGPKTAKVTIVEFSDFQYPFCSKGKKVMEKWLRSTATKVRIVFRDFPLSFPTTRRRRPPKPVSAPTSRASSGRCTTGYRQPEQPR